MATIKTSGPIIKLNELTPNPRYLELSKAWKDNPNYRSEVNKFKTALTKILRKKQFTKRQAARLISEIIKDYFVYPYLEEKTSGSLYDIERLINALDYFETSLTRERIISNYWK